MVVKNFLEAFYQHLGEYYLQPHEDGLISLFETIKQELPKHISRIDTVRDVWSGKKQVEIIKNPPITNEEIDESSR